jgi:lysophospholipase L1-like esterase
MRPRPAATNHRRLAALGLLLASAALLLPSPAWAAPGLPSSMASAGDSITRAYNTGFFPYTDNPSGSWSTGTNTTVNSHYLRILSRHPSIKGRNYNDAVSGAKMADLAGQMRTAVGQHVGYVTVEMGGNDICTSSEAGMTSVATFQAQFAAAMNTIATGSPNTLVFVASIPDVYQLWSVLHGSFSAQVVWGLFGVCQSMLANPTSTAQADVDRRARVRQRDIDFNAVLATVCAQYDRCRFDGNAVFGTAFAASDVTTRDYFHPSIAGQAKLAAVTWSAGFWGP